MCYHSDMRRLVAIALFGAAVAAGPPLICAQGRGFVSVPAAPVTPVSGVGFTPGFAAPINFPTVALPSGVTGTIGEPFVFGRGPFVVGAAFFSPFFWGGAAVVQQPTPQPFILEVAPSQVEAKEEPKPASSSLLIERRGDRYVRISGVPEEISFTQRGKATNATELSPTVLVFRDGRRIEVTNYAIVDKALYAYGDYWTAGYWTREILLAELDLPTTISLNLERGVKFQLPSAPNEVITRP